MSSTHKRATKDAKETRIRKRPGITRHASAPLGSIGFKRFIYILSAITLAFAVYYAYRMSEIYRFKESNLHRTMKQAQGKPLTTGETKLNRRAELQQRIEELSGMLGLEPVVLASAIANLVKPNIPEESYSSILKQEAKSSTDSILSAFTEGLTAPITPKPTAAPTATATSASGGGMTATGR